jgi:hypothetical protein
MAPFSTSTRAPLLKYQFRLRFVLEEGAEQNVGEAVIWEFFIPTTARNGLARPPRELIYARWRRGRAPQKS